MAGKHVQKIFFEIHSIEQGYLFIISRSWNDGGKVKGFFAGSGGKKGIPYWVISFLMNLIIGATYCLPSNNLEKKYPTP